MVINGLTQKRVMLTANTNTVIQFNKPIQHLCANVSGGDVLFKVGPPITGANDLSANILRDGQSYSGFKETGFSQINVFSTVAAFIQWDTY